MLKKDDQFMCKKMWSIWKIRWQLITDSLFRITLSHFRKGSAYSVWFYASPTLKNATFLVDLTKFVRELILLSYVIQVIAGTVCVMECITFRYSYEILTFLFLLRSFDSIKISVLTFLLMNYIARPVLFYYIFMSFWLGPISTYLVTTHNKIFT